MRKSFFCLTGSSLALSLALSQAVIAQVPAAAPAATALVFEVATVKLARPLQEQAMSGKMHIGMTVDKARVDIGGMALSDLVAIAYKVKPHQINGPDWLNIDRFDIMAKMPEGATEEQVPLMLQALLADRFKLTFHKEMKDHAIYALVVGKGGIKMKESPPDPEKPKEGEEPAPPKEEKGFTTINNGSQSMQVKQTANGAEMRSTANGKMKMTMVEGHMRMEMEKSTMAGLAEALSRFVDKPVMDMTELKGNYQIAIEMTMEDLQNIARMQGMQIPGAAPGGGGASSSRPAETIGDPSGSTIFSSVQAMGLKLEARKSPIETIIIDHVEKAPSEN